VRERKRELVRDKSIFLCVFKRVCAVMCTTVFRGDAERKREREKERKREREKERKREREKERKREREKERMRFVSV